MPEIMTAHRRFMRQGDSVHESLQTMFQALNARDNASEEQSSSVEDLSFSQEGDDILVDLGNGPKIMTPWGFDQICRAIGAPKNYINKKANTDLAVECLLDDVKQTINLRSEKYTEDPPGSLGYVHTKDDVATLRAWNSTQYRRVLDSQVTRTIIEHTDDDVRPAGYLAGGGTENPEKTGLYSSDRDAFWFIANENDPIEHGNEVLNKGMIIWNSEVGYTSFGFMSFYYRHICGNHIVWGAQNVQIRRRRHVGKVHELVAELPAYLEQITTQNENDELTAMLDAAQEATFWTQGGQEDAVKSLQKRGFPKKDADASIAAAVIDAELNGGDPYSVWGVAQGITRHSQTIPFQDKRNKLDVMAGQLISSVS